MVEAGLHELGSRNAEATNDSKLSSCMPNQSLVPVIITVLV